MESQKPEPKSDEIDLGQLFSRIGDSISNAWMGFMRSLAAMRRIPIEHKWSFILIIMASLAIGISFTFFVRKNFYESKMILSSDYLNKKLAENIIDKLDALAKESNHKGLATALGLPDSLARNIIGFSISPFVQEADIVELEILKEQLRRAQTDPNKEEMIEDVIERIEMENRHSFEITVRTLNPRVLPNLQNDIVGYFAKNPYIRKRVESNRAILLEKKKKLARDINKLDSLKFVIYQNYKSMAEQARGSNNVILSDQAVTNPVDVYKQGLTIYKEYEEVSSEVDLQKDFEVVDGFTVFSEPASAGVVTMALYSILIGVIVAYLDVGLRNFNKYLANLE